MQKVFAFLRDVILGLRTLYIAIMLLPLWGCSIYYRVSVEYYPHAHWVWVDDHWPLICALSFLHGALALWFFIEKVHEVQLAGKKVNGWDMSNIWLLAISVFLTGLGGVLAANGVNWGDALVRGGVVAMPVFVLWAFGFSYHGNKETQQSEQSPTQSA